MVAYWCHDLFLKIIISLVKIVYLCFYMFTPMCHISDCHVQRVYVCTTEFIKWIAVTYAGTPSAYRPIRARLAGQWEAGLKNISIIWISGRRRGGIVWVNPSSKCASWHSNEMHQRIIHTHVNVSSKAYVYDDTIYNFCARARFAGCTHLRNIILALNTV